MKAQKPIFQKRYLWISAAGGFGFAFFLSLIGGNMIVTSLKRGVLGLVLMAGVYYVLRFWLSHFMQPAALDSMIQLNQPETGVGGKIDFTLPAETPGSEPSAADFQPWIVQSPTAEMSDEQAQNMARALRAMQE